MTEPRYRQGLCWFRRDLRNHDHAALYHALKSSRSVHCVFVFDTDILNGLAEKTDRRVEFILDAVVALDTALRRHGGGLHVLYGRATEEIPRLAQTLGADAVFANRDYEPYAVARDASIACSLQAHSIAFLDFKDHVIFERDELLTAGGRAFRVFTPYKTAWLKKLTPFYLQSYPVKRYLTVLAAAGKARIPSLQTLKFQSTGVLRSAVAPANAAALWADFLRRIDDYPERRDYPALKGPSYLSVHLRFGTVSIRELAGQAMERGTPGAMTWLSELIWRDFYHMILAHFPQAAERAFCSEFSNLIFPGEEHHFQAWCEGKTGYPLVDAAMRQLNKTGYMHNRLRMVTASFLVKDLLIDWRRGENYFARKLLDFDLAANNGGWQWAASTGCDAQPYFRIFNPIMQSQKFDPQGRFIRRYVPEIAHFDDPSIHPPWLASLETQRRAACIIGEHYPRPIVDHTVQRQRALALFQAARRAPHTA